MACTNQIKYKKLELIRSGSDTQSVVNNGSQDRMSDDASTYLYVDGVSACGDGDLGGEVRRRDSTPWRTESICMETTERRFWNRYVRFFTYRKEKRETGAFECSFKKAFGSIIGTSGSCNDLIAFTTNKKRLKKLTLKNKGKKSIIYHRKCTCKCDLQLYPSIDSEVLIQSFDSILSEYASGKFSASQQLIRGGHLNMNKFNTSAPQPVQHYTSDGEGQNNTSGSFAYWHTVERCNNRPMQAPPGFTGSPQRYRIATSEDTVEDAILNLHAFEAIDNLYDFRQAEDAKAKTKLVKNVDYFAIGERLAEKRSEIFELALIEARNREIQGNSSPVTFSITYRAQFGEEVCLCGSDSSMGCWNTLNAVPMTWAAGDNWSVTISPSKSAEKIYYKFILRTSRYVFWEPGLNHCIDLRTFNLSMAKKRSVRDSWGTGTADT